MAFSQWLGKEYGKVKQYTWQELKKHQKRGKV
jgi:hypothetical protein